MVCSLHVLLNRVEFGLLIASSSCSGVALCRIGYRTLDLRSEIMALVPGTALSRTAVGKLLTLVCLCRQAV